jgi:hypothetical protein
MGREIRRAESTTVTFYVWRWIQTNGNLLISMNKEESCLFEGEQWRLGD